LLLSDVLDWRASEIASLLALSVSAVRSALHRARVTLAKQYHADERARAATLHADEATNALLERYLQAWETADVAGLVALMTEDATFAMPPSPSWYRGRDAIGAVIAAGAFSPAARHRWRFCPTGANGGPAFAVYRAAGSDDPPRVFGIQVLTLDDGAADALIADVTTFLEPPLFGPFGFPPELPE
jgi:RNA polymerase sigma-70 factor (ECF subfamily)